MANDWTKPISKNVRMFIVICSLLFVFNLIANFFLYLLFSIFGMPIDIVHLNIFDIISLGYVAIILFIPFLIVISFFGGIMLEFVFSILVKMR